MLDRAVGMMQLTRQDHDQLRQAVAVLAEAIDPDAEGRS